MTIRYSATYSPEDNKLRLYASQRLDAETYERIKAAGFRWAPKQDLFVAPMWTPGREDLLAELAGEIDDEDRSLVDRAEQRADRFDGYRDRRTGDAEAASKAVHAIADGIPFGQPILVGHHSERHARRDAERIENGMRKAVKMWETAAYWKERAAGAIAHAKYKELPTVRARRIKTIEADRRKVERNKAANARATKLWQMVLEPPADAKKNNGEPATARDIALHVANYHSHLSRCFTLADYPRDPPASQYEGAMSLWGALDGNVISAEQAARIALEALAGYPARADRWLAHYDNRLTYERAMLEEQGAADLLKPKPRRELAPLLNYRAPGGSITIANPYDRGRTLTYPQVDMTKAAYAAIYKDYKGARIGPDRQHRFRTAMIKHSLVSVFLTDSKEHPAPSSTTPPPLPPPPDRPAPAPIARRVDETPADIQAMRDSLRAGGVRVIAAPQLFPTPRELAARLVELAGVEPGHRVLEPSAGHGALLLHLPAGVHIVACEINADLCAGLKSFCRPIATLIQGDFLEMVGAVPGFDRIIMNPPFEDGADIKHILHARRLLAPGGRLVAICANGPRQQRALEPIADSWEPLPAGTFKSSGTMVNAVLLTIEAPAEATTSAPAPASQLALL